MHYKHNKHYFSPKMNRSLKHWKEAATLIVAAEQRLCSRTTTAQRASRCNYDTLLLKRSGKSGFMPNAYVFPGGLVDPTDFSSEWQDVFESAGQNDNGFGLRRVRQTAETRPPLFATDRVELGSPIPGEVAFRICALRETFEESGVLLVVPKGQLNPSIQHEDTIHHGVHGDICPGELDKWRSLVNQNPANFIRMCRELEVLPNIWALHEWSNWLTPEGRYGVRRFDTAFFICCLNEIPHTLQDQKEIELFQWSTPSEVLQSYEAKEFWIAPPQFYELGRLCQFPSLNDLHRFARERGVEGCERWMPVITVEDDKLLSLLPGDGLYPGTVSESSTGHDGGSALHRFVIEDSYTIRLQINISPKYKHLLPVLPLGSKSLL